METKKQIKNDQRVIVTNSESVWFGKKGVVIQVTPKEVVVQMDEVIMDCDIAPFSFNEVEAIDK